MASWILGSWYAMTQPRDPGRLLVESDPAP